MTTTASRQRLGVHEQVRRGRRASLGRACPRRPRCGSTSPSEATACARDRDDRGARERGPRDGGGPVARLAGRAEARVVAVDDLDRAPRAPRRPWPEHAVAGQHGVRSAANSGASRSTGANRHSSSRPVGHGEVGDVERRGARGARGLAARAPTPWRVRAVGDGAGVVRRQAVAACSCRGGRHQPTAPSICSSMRRLSSRAYSMGSSRAMGSTNPRTIIAMASVSGMPRDMR